MNVLHLIYDHPLNPWVGGGGATRARAVNAELARRGCTVRVICGRFPGAPPALRQDGVEYHFRGLSAPYPLSRATYAVAAARELRRGAYDIAVIDFSAYTPIRAPVRRRRPVVGIVHHLTGPTAAGRWGRALGRRVAVHEAARLRRLDRLSAVSEHTANQLRALLPGREVAVIGNGVADELFGLVREETSSLLLHLGRLDVFHKGLDVLLDAFDRLTPLHPELRLCIAGGGKDAAEVRRRVDRSPHRERIDLVGPVSERRKRELLATAELVVMPSRMEGWGMVAAEAMAASAPLVATRVDALPEVTGHGVGAVLVPPGDVDALAAAISTLHADPARRRALGEAARARAARRFRWSAVGAAHHQFLQRAVAAHVAPED